MPWWKAPETRAELGISDKQSKDIDDIFQETLPALRAAKDELDKLDDAVAKLIKEGTADIAVVAQQVAQAEQARANLTTKRTVMLYRMHRLLTPEQRAKLDAMFAAARPSVGRTTTQRPPVCGHSLARTTSLEAFRE